MKQVKAIALCHNVTPVVEEETSTENNTNGDGHIELSDSVTDSGINYQAASPDEVALVQWTESVGLTLVNRDLTEIHLRSPMGDIMKFTVLRVFPFTSETKRMGIIVREEKSGEITFYMKGKKTFRFTVYVVDWLCGVMRSRYYLPRWICIWLSVFNESINYDWFYGNKMLNHSLLEQNG